MVVLSGCNSAQGSVLPGTGLLGRNRAWLAAGTRNAIGSRWAVPDGSGSLLRRSTATWAAVDCPPRHCAPRSNWRCCTRAAGARALSIGAPISRWEGNKNWPPL